ncbi:MAG: ABC transporter permease [Balneola sp.]
MLKNYIKIAFRNLFKNKVYSFINIFGLAVGIAVCALIALYVQNEWSYDEFHENSENIYRVWAEETLQDGRVILNTSTPFVVVETIENSIPEIENITYINSFSNVAGVPQNDQKISERVSIIHDDFFDIFDFKFVEGSRESVFNSPSSIVISKSAAKRHFGETSALNQVLSLKIGEEFRDFTVEGVLEDAPTNSTIQYELLIPEQYFAPIMGEQGMRSWFNIFGPSYVTLKDGTDPEELTDKFADMMRAALGDEEYEMTQYKIGLQPLTDVHLNTDFPGNGSDPVYSYILSIIALLILVIACVNFMTLSISRSTSRAKEVGVRKTIGAIREHLMYQFWGEALLMTIVAIILGVFFAELLLPFFNDLSGTVLEFSFRWQNIVALLGCSVIISLIAGIYPALILSGFRPTEVLKGRLSQSSEKGSFNKVMVVFQFTLSIALIIGTFTIREQLSFVQQKNLGFQKEQILTFNSGFVNTPDAGIDNVFANSLSRKQILESELSGFPGIEQIATSSFTPVQTAGWFRVSFPNEQNQAQPFHTNIVDEDFIPTLGIKLLSGRNFSEENASDKERSIIVNQAFVDYFNLEDPIGKRIPGPNFLDHEIIGVVDNFHYESLHSPVEPLVLTQKGQIIFSGINNMSLSNSAAPKYTVKLTTDDLQATIAGIRGVWENVAPGAPFDYTFVDEALDSQYRQEQRLSKIVTSASLLTVLIAGLGLFGLASLMVVRRTKEIGVRKVLGASSSNILLLINKEFTLLIVLSFLIATPIAWFAMKEWLKDFAYSIELGLGLFLVAGIATLVLSWLVVSFQSIKATLINPVDSLKSE